MKIFISWSGKPSHNIALQLREWLPLLFREIDLFVSSEDIRKGKRWPLEVSKELDASSFGIVCLTHDNLGAPWILFESGALSKSLKDASLYTLLVGGLVPTDVEGPLSHFQHTVFEKEDFFKLIRSINEAHGSAKHEDARLRKVFEKFWDELEAGVSAAVKTETKPEKKQNPDDMLRELLETTSYIAKQMPNVPTPVSSLAKAPIPLCSMIPINKHEAFGNQFIKGVTALNGELGRIIADAKIILDGQLLGIILPDSKTDQEEKIVLQGLLIFGHVAASLGFNASLVNYSMGTRSGSTTLPAILRFM